MPKHVTSFVPALFVALLASVALISLWSGAAHAEKNCVAEPNLQAAQSGHWYYRIDRASGHRCWYIGPQGMKVRRALQPNAQRSPMPIPRPAVNTSAQATAGEQIPIDVSARSPGELEPIGLMGFETASTREPEPDERSETNAGEELPLIWPVLTDAELAAAQPADHGPMPELLGTVLAFASAVAFAAIGWTIFARPAVRRLWRRHRRAQSGKLRNPKVHNDEVRTEFAGAVTASRHPGTAPQPKPDPSSGRLDELEDIHRHFEELLRLLRGPERTAA